MSFGGALIRKGYSFAWLPSRPSDAASSVPSGSVSVAPASTVVLGDRFARELPELAVAWQAEEAPDPRLLVLNEPLAAELGLDPAWLRTDDGVRLLIGTSVPAGANPVAQAYAGHQFGGYVPRLGDGRALLLGELDAGGGLRDLHLKGSGRTPFARGGDGLAAVGPMLREYVVSEAMHALGIPTTRSLAVVATGRPVRRETVLPGAVLARVASSHLRVGSFQYARATDDVDLLRRLADHAISPAPPRRRGGRAALPRPVRGGRRRPGVAGGPVDARGVRPRGDEHRQHDDLGRDHRLRAVRLPRRLRPGHGLQLDRLRRPLRLRQPAAGGRVEPRPARRGPAPAPRRGPGAGGGPRGRGALGGFRPRYDGAWSAGMRAKLGLPAGLADDVAAPLVEELLGLLREGHVDHTSFFRALARAARGDVDPARNLFLDLAGFDSWAERWRALGPDADAMDRVNPVYIPRNHLVEEALAAATEGDLDPLDRLLDAVAAPFDERPGLERYAAPAPDDFGAYRTFCGT